MPQQIIKVKMESNLLKYHSVNRDQKTQVS